MNRIDEIRCLLPAHLGEQIFSNAEIQFDKLQEIRLRAKQPCIIQYDNREYIYHDIKVTKDDINQCLQYISDYSVYAYQEDISQGFITVKGGHRVGITGKAVMDNGNVKSQKFISFINIRVAHQMIGCADGVMDFVCKNNRLCHTLIISPPGCGKTTLLRDIIRQLSLGSICTGKKICVVDERSEIAACFEGIPQNDLGPRTDVLDCCYKRNGMLMLIRSMSPDIIAVDEIGGIEDLNAIEYIINCGCTVIGTIHAQSCDEVIRKPEMTRLIGENIFSRMIVLSRENGVGTIKDLIEI